MSNLLLANPALLASLIAPSMTRQEARVALFRGGWQFLDGGSFSSVWLSPAGDRVIKVTKPDAGSDVTLAASFASPSPHLPQVYGKVELANGGFALEVERLEPVSYDEYREFHHNVWKLVLTEDDDDQLEPALRCAVVALRNEMADRPGAEWDFHSGNIMKRGDCIVLTDVVYDYERFNGSANMGGTKHDAANVAMSCSDDPVDQLMQPVFDKAA